MFNHQASLLDRFVKDLVWTFGAQAKSIVLYGSTVTGDWHAKHSNHNLLLVLDRIQQPELIKLNEILANWLKAGHPAPLLMTPEELHESADVYPMEYMDMKEAYRILHGADLLASLQSSRTNLRHECEHELRGKLMKLRQQYATSADHPESIRTLLIQSWSTFAIIGRSVLRLNGWPVPSSKMEVYRALADFTGLKLEPFLQVQALRDDPWASPAASWGDLTWNYLRELETLVNYIDRAAVKTAKE